MEVHLIYKYISSSTGFKDSKRISYFVIAPFFQSLSENANNLEVLTKLAISLKESGCLSSEKELDFLQDLLESREINALVNIHTKVGKITKDEKCAPIMSSSMQVCIYPTYVANHFYTCVCYKCYHVQMASLNNLKKGMYFE